MLKYKVETLENRYDFTSKNKCITQNINFENVLDLIKHLFLEKEDFFFVDYTINKLFRYEKKKIKVLCCSFSKEKFYLRTTYKQTIYLSAIDVKQKDIEDIIFNNYL